MTFTVLLRVVLLHKGSPFLWLAVPTACWARHSNPLPFVFWAVHPWPAIAMLFHILVSHTPRVPRASAFALSRDDCSGAAEQSRETGALLGWRWRRHRAPDFGFLEDSTQSGLSLWETEADIITWKGEKSLKPSCFIPHPQASWTGHVLFLAPFMLTPLSPKWPSGIKANTFDSMKGGVPSVIFFPKNYKTRQLWWNTRKTWPEGKCIKEMAILPQNVQGHAIVKVTSVQRFMGWRLGPKIQSET